MSDHSLSDLVSEIGKLDIGLLATHTADHQIAVRPMSNNAEVDADGTSYYFTTEDSRTVSDIREQSKVSLSFEGDDSYVVVQGEAALHTDKDVMKSHWSDGIARYFDEGLNTKGLTMIAVKAKRINYWIGRDEGEIEP